MQTLKTLRWVAFISLWFAMSGTTWAEEFVAGKDYVVLPKEVPTSDPSKIEVVEIFWYGCPHCYDFNPLVKSWVESLPEDVDFSYLPSTGGAVSKVHARAFYTARALGKLDDLHQVLFDTLIKERKTLNNEDEVVGLFVTRGLEESLVRKTYNSPGVGAKVEAAYQRAIGYQSAYVPALVVNGKYRIGASEAGSFTRMLQVADYLIGLERH
ncbi:MAG: thiol:disulfide interchange protein DsbA/DsbL [Hahellaceae bacterium]|nr:thiol:disulfide interchange protein DsbA/DsbL [Hahellaceae bacterium]